VSDKEILQVVEETMDCKEPRRWFYALMDAGVELKKTRPGVNRRSKHYTQQSAFIGSHRQVRAAVLKFITNQGSVTPQSIYSELLFAKERIDAALAALCRDEFLVATRSGRYRVR
jgi:A/G-specific adenine glycosylase